MSLELQHHYGPQVHILEDAYLQTGLAQLCSENCRHPAINYWVQRLYQGLLQHAVNTVFERSPQKLPTRMIRTQPEAVIEASLPTPHPRIVVSSLARAGILPGHVCFDELNHLFDPEFIRQDHIVMNRITDAQHQVTGADLRASKIGGSIEDSYLLIPDPMGATGSTLLRTLEEYTAYGTPRAVLALHLIVTPEYLRKINAAHPSVKIFSIRLDRALSTKRALSCTPGELWSEEKGLNSEQYIVPGGGGLGEILNNSFV